MEPLMNGRFSVYEAPDGGIKVAYRPDGETDSKLLEIPAMVINMARMGAAGKLNPFTAMKEMMKHGTPDIGNGPGPIGSVAEESAAMGDIIPPA